MEGEHDLTLVTGKVLADDKTVETYGIKETDHIICMVQKVRFTRMLASAYSCRRSQLSSQKPQSQAVAAHRLPLPQLQPQLRRPPHQHQPHLPQVLLRMHPRLPHPPLPRKHQNAHSTTHHH